MIYVIEAIDGEKNLDRPEKVLSIDGCSVEAQSEVDDTTYYEITEEEYKACIMKFAEIRSPYKEANNTISENGQIITRYMNELREIEIGLREETSLEPELIEALVVEKNEAEDIRELWREGARQGISIYDRLNNQGEEHG